MYIKNYNTIIFFIRILRLNTLYNKILNQINIRKKIIMILLYFILFNLNN